MVSLGSELGSGMFSHHLASCSKKGNLVTFKINFFIHYLITLVPASQANYYVSCRRNYQQYRHDQLTIEVNDWNIMLSGHQFIEAHIWNMIIHPRRYLKSTGSFNASAQSAKRQPLAGILHFDLPCGFLSGGEANLETFGW